VLHSGYLEFLDRHADAAPPLVLGASFVADFPVLRKEIRALPPERAAALVGGVVVEREDLPGVVTGDLVVPDEEIMRDLVARYGLKATFERTFLRWDRSWSLAGRPAEFAGTVSAAEVDRRFAGLASSEAARSSDWWRQVGAVAVRDGVVLGQAHNEHKPTEYAPYLDGDPRNDFSRGVRIDLSTALHAEAGVVARAAADGVPLRGADLYVTTFPCPGCARLVAAAGFARCWFLDPYAVLHGDEILRAGGVALIRVVS